MKFTKKSNVLIIFLISCLCLSSCTRKYSSTKEDAYENYVAELSYADQFMPKLEELGEYTSVFSSRRTPNDIFFDTTDSVALIVQYEKEQYDMQVDRIMRKYRFIVEGADYLMDVDANVSGFDFKVVDDNRFYGELLHTLLVYDLLFIGFNETDCKVAYLYYWDHALDCIKDLDKFIKTKFVLK